jgi:hypothetical protein
MVFKRILPGKLVFSGRGRLALHPCRLARPVGWRDLLGERSNAANRPIHFPLMLRCTKRIAAMQHHRFKAKSDAPIFGSSTRSKKSK